tara:strand:+ start:73 stop:1416 length:1344 start_codon:yes stop_codon:yes gene_type:complete
MEGVLTYFDLLLVPIYLVIILIVCSRIKSKKIAQFPEYKYFTKGVLFKLLGVSAFMSIYLFYYGGGDTINYYKGARAVGNLLLEDFDKGFAVLFNTSSNYNHLSSFNYNTGYPSYYMWRDPSTFSVSRYSALFYLIGAKSFIITSFMVCCFSYIGLWKFYRLLNILYPGYEKGLAYIILFLPSIAFWGSGVMKDSYTVSSACWITYNFYMVLILRKKVLVNSMFLLINLFIIINMKPYVILSLLPGMIIWLNSAYLKEIKNAFLKILILPLLSVVILTIGFYVFQNLSSLMGIYGEVDSAIEQAQVIRTDLLRSDQYGTNNYDIGKFDGSFISLISVAPNAIFTALFRPFLWEIGSPTMVFSAIENFILIVFTFFTLIRVSPITVLKTLLKEPFLLYCLIFSIFFAFGVGIAGTNFGAMVRYKTPLMPFFFSMIYMLSKLNKSYKNS